MESNKDTGGQKEAGKLEKRVIKTNITEQECAELKRGNKLNVDILGSGGAKGTTKEITINSIEKNGEIYTIEGTTKIIPGGGGGKLVTLEISPADHAADIIMF